MGTKKDHVFRFTDACYSLEPDEQKWLATLSAESRHFLDRGMGVAAWGFRRNEWTSDALPQGVDPIVGQAMWQAAPGFSGDELLSLFMGGRATSATERLGVSQGLDEHPAGVPLAALGIKDFHALTVWDAAGRGVALAGGAGEVLRPARQRIAHLERLGSHLLAGFRLRTALHQVDAVLEPGGRSLHAEGEARDADHQAALVRAVRAFDAARSQRGPQDAETALEAFEGLVAGRWSIVQSFESDGRRYLVAVQNPPGSIPVAALTPQESQALVLRAQGLPHKLIGYELGVPDTVSFQLVHQGMDKLGIARETDLPLLFRAHAAQALAQVMEARHHG